MLLGLLACLLLIFLCAIRIPIAYSLGAIGAVGLTSYLGFESAFEYVALRLHTVLASFTFTAVPLFFIMGYFAVHAGLTTEAFYAARIILSRLPGGVASAVVAASAMFGACSGAGLPAAAALGRIAVPEMVNMKYSPRLATGVVASATPLAVLIPPSIPMVIYGGVTNTSVARLLIAGIVPGIFASLVFMAGITIYVMRCPEVAPVSAGSFTCGERMNALKNVWGIVFLFILVAGSIYMGWGTPTEAAAIGAFGSMLLCYATGKLSWKAVKSVLYETVRMCGMVFTIIAMAQIFSGYMTRVGVIQEIVDIVKTSHMGLVQFFVVITILYIILGMFIDSTSMIVLTMPAVFPIAMSLGLDPVWFGVIMIIYIEMAAITPPLGINVYLVKGAIGDLVSLFDIFKGSAMFFCMWILILAVLFAFPQIVLWLPNLMKGEAAF
jgi:C4-dicarboxylate transporter, DctM subunit